MLMLKSDPVSAESSHKQYYFRAPMPTQYRGNQQDHVGLTHQSSTAGVQIKVQTGLQRFVMQGVAEVWVVIQCVTPIVKIEKWLA